MLGRGPFQLARSLEFGCAAARLAAPHDAPGQGAAQHGSGPDDAAAGAGAEPPHGAGPSTGASASGMARGAGPKARREFMTTRRPRMWLPVPPTTAPMPNGIALAMIEAPPRTANWRMKTFRSRSTSGPTTIDGSVVVTSSPQ